MNLQDLFYPVFWGMMVVPVRVLSNYSQRKLLSISLFQKSLSRRQYHSMTKKSHVVWRRYRKSFRGDFLTTLVNEFLDRNLPWTSLLCRWHHLIMKVDHSHGQVEPMVQLMVITVVSAAESQATQTSIQGAEVSALQWGVVEEAIMTTLEIFQLKAAT